VNEEVSGFADIRIMNHVRNTITPPSPRCGMQSIPFSTSANTGSTIRRISIKPKKTTDEQRRAEEDEEHVARESHFLWLLT